MGNELSIGPNLKSELMSTYWQNVTNINKVPPILIFTMVPRWTIWQWGVCAGLNQMLTNVGVRKLRVMRKLRLSSMIILFHLASWVQSSIEEPELIYRNDWLFIFRKKLIKTVQCQTKNINLKIKVHTICRRRFFESVSKNLPRKISLK